MPEAYHGRITKCSCGKGFILQASCNAVDVTALTRLVKTTVLLTLTLKCQLKCNDYQKIQRQP